MKAQAREFQEFAGFWSLRLCMLIVLAILGVVFYDIVTKGSGVISWGFLTQAWLLLQVMLML